MRSIPYVPELSWAGLGEVSGRGVWINGKSAANHGGGLSVVAHEIGHKYVTSCPTSKWAETHASNTTLILRPAHKTYLPLFLFLHYPHSYGLRHASVWKVGSTKLEEVCVTVLLNSPNSHTPCSLSQLFPTPQPPTRSVRFICWTLGFPASAPALLSLYSSPCPRSAARQSRGLSASRA
jgi:hypothetical protein